MKKLWKSMLAVLVSVSLIAGWFALPVSAAGPDAVLDEYFTATETRSGLLDIEGLFGAPIVPGDPVDMVFQFTIKNDHPHLPMKYTLNFADMMGIIDNATDSILDPDDVFSGAYGQGGVTIITPSATFPLVPAQHTNSWVQTEFMKFYDGTKQLPWMTYLVRTDDSAELHADPSTIVFLHNDGVQSTIPWHEGFNGQTYGTGELAGDKRVLLPGAQETYELHFGWPYERNVSGGTSWWDTNIDSMFGRITGDFLFSYMNSQGNYLTYGPPSWYPGQSQAGDGGLYPGNWIEYQITAEYPPIVVEYEVDGAPYGTPWNSESDGWPLALLGVPPKTAFIPGGWMFTPPGGGPDLNSGSVDFTDPLLYGIVPNTAGEYVFKLVAVYTPDVPSQATVKFAMDDAGTIPCTFVKMPSTFPSPVNVGTTVADNGSLPKPDAPANKVFAGWKYFDGAKWVAVGNDFPFSAAKEYVFVAVFEPSPPVKVQVQVNGQLMAGTPFAWESSELPLTVEQKLKALGLYDPLVGTEDGKKLVFIPPNDKANPLEVGTDAIHWDDPASYGLAADASGIYTFLLEARSDSSPADYKGIDTLVRFFLDENAPPTPYIATGTTPYTAWVKAYDTVAGQTGAGKAFPIGLPVPPARADGWVFDHWEYVKRDSATGAAAARSTVTAAFQFDPRAVALNLPTRTGLSLPVVTGYDEDYYVCDLYAVYKAPPAPVDDGGIPWWPFAALGAGGVVVIGGLTLPWLAALPLLPVLLLCGGKLLLKEKPAQGKAAEPAKVPKTGEDDAWLAVPFAAICLAGLGLILVRRRREECEA